MISVTVIIQVKPDNFLNYIETWGPHWEVKFDVYLVEYRTMMNILHLVPVDQPKIKIPSVSTYKDGMILIEVYIRKRIFKIYLQNIRAQRWYSIHIKLFAHPNRKVLSKKIFFSSHIILGISHSSSGWKTDKEDTCLLSRPRVLRSC